MNRMASLFGPSRPTSMRRPARRRARLGVEAMEQRALLSNIPILQTINDPANGQWLPSGQFVAPLSGLEQTVIKGDFGLLNASSNATTEAELTAGELVTVTADVQDTYVFGGQVTGNQASALTVYAPSGTQVASQSTLNGIQDADLLSGQKTNDSELIFRAPTTGLYTFAVGQNAAAVPFLNTAGFALTIRPMALDTSDLAPDQNAADAAKLSFTGGGLYAFLDPTDTVLTLAGPTGRGFQVTGQFQEILNSAGPGLTTATITATGSSITLDTGLGPVNLPLAQGTSFTVTTQANGTQGAFGEVNSAGLTFPGESIIQNIISPLASQVGMDFRGFGFNAGTPGVEFGIALGGDPAVQANDAPVNPAVPYLYLNVSTGFDASFGKIEAGAMAKGASVDFDPSDPSIFVDIKGLPGLGDIKFGLSEHGEIAFTPEQAPNHWGDKALYGDVYYGGTLDLAELTDNEVPVEISGEAVINFDTSAGSWTSGVAQKVKDLFAGDATTSELETEAFGINATVGLALDAEGLGDLSVSLDAATLIVDGPAQAIYFRGGTLNPLAGTPVAFLDQNANGAAQGFTADGYIDLDGQFDATLYGNFTIDQIGLSGTLDVSNVGITASASFNLGFLYGNVQGSIDWNGDFYLGGSATVNISADIGIPGFADVYGGVYGTLGFALNDNGEAQVWGDVSVAGSAYFAGSYIGSIDQQAYFNVQANVGLSISSFITEAENAIDSAVYALYDAWEQQIESGWSWFWSFGWL
jgi:hypothetical protein